MQQFLVDIQAPAGPLLMYAMQADSLSRKFQLVISDGGTPWTPPEGAVWSVRFGAPGVSAGWYDTITPATGDPYPAITVAENVITVEIAEQALEISGRNHLAVLVNDSAGYQIASWPITLVVKQTPGLTAPAATVFYNALTAQVAQVLNQTTNGLEQIEQATQQAIQEIQSIDAYTKNEANNLFARALVTTSPAAASLKIYPDAESTIIPTLYGFTSQAGSGDPSPENVRKITVGGIKGEDGNLYVPVTVTGKSSVTENVPITAPMCEGDSLVLSTKSGCDKVLVLDGSDDEGWGVESDSVTGASGSKRFYISLSGHAVNGDPSAKSIAYFNYLNSIDNNSIYQGRQDNVGTVLESPSANVARVFVRVAGISTVEALRAYLSARPLTVWYRSTAYTEANDIPVQLETHANAIVTIDGTNTLFAQGTDGYSVALPGAANGAVICDRFANLTAASNAVTIPASQFPASVTSLEQANTWAQSNPVTILYPLTTPITYAHDPITFTAGPDSTGLVTVIGQSGGTVSALYNQSLVYAIANLTNKIAALESAQSGV